VFDGLTIATQGRSTTDPADDAKNARG